MKKITTALLATSLTCLTTAAFAEEAPNYKETLTGDWNGVRTSLAEKGIATDIVYKGDVMGNVSGGVKEGARYLDNLDVLFALDGEKLIGSKGTTGLIHLLNNNGGQPNEDLVGSAQGIDNIEVPEATAKLYQAWIQQSFMEDKLSVLAGLYDLNSEFQVTETSLLFLHSTYGAGTDISQSGQNGPSIFPFTSLTARVKYQPSADSYMQAAVLDGVAGDPTNDRGTQIDLGDNDGALLIAEGGYSSGNKKLGVGIWHYTREFDDHVDTDSLGNPEQDHSQGIYFIGQYPLYNEPGAEGQGLSGFGRLGFANGDVNQFDYAWSAGVVYTGFIPGRDAGQLGFAVAGAHNSSKFEEASELAGFPVDSTETAFELTYNDALTPWLSLQPDVQYIVNPGTDPSLDDSLVLGMRTIINF
jgi:porin